jgi:hypothetical protein
MGSPCPDCGAHTSVRADVCDLCLADLGEWSLEPLPPAAMEGRELTDLRFSDVLTEIRTVIDLAETGDDGSLVADAGRRAEALLDALRGQFLRDLGVPVTGAAGAGAP